MYFSASSIPSRRGRSLSGSGTWPSIATTISGDVPQVTCGWISVARMSYTIEAGTLVAVQRPPVGHRGIPLARLWCKRAPFQVLDSGLIDGDEAHPCTGLDGHVAQRHAGFHRQPANRTAAKLDGITCSARRTDSAQSWPAQCPWRSRPCRACPQHEAAWSSTFSATDTAWPAHARPRRYRYPAPCSRNAPCVLVCESPQTTVMPGNVTPFSGPIT